jgi:hypothetical protein
MHLCEGFGIAKGFSSLIAGSEAFGDLCGRSSPNQQPGWKFCNKGVATKVY